MEPHTLRHKPCQLYAINQQSKASPAQRADIQLEGRGVEIAEADRHPNFPDPTVIDPC